VHVCIEERIQLRPGAITDFYGALEAALPQIEALGIRLQGAFQTAGTTGRWNEVFVYWEFDGWEHYGRALNERIGAAAVSDLADPDWVLRTGGSSIAMNPSKYCPTLGQLLDSGVRGNVFLHEYIHVVPGKREEYVQHYVDAYLEATRKAGRELVGLWGMQKSANDVLILLAMKDWDAVAYSRTAKPDAYAEKPWRTSAPVLRSDYDLRMLVPGPKPVNPLRLD
jgi:hypothetical protein